MDISGGLNRPVSMYNTNTGNNLNLAVNSENKIYSHNVFSPEFTEKEFTKKITSPIKKKRKNRRLNTIDTDFLPEEVQEVSSEENNANFFVENKTNPHIEKLKKTINFIFKSIPLINYFYLKHKEQKIKKTVQKLNDIIQTSDELINSAVPYGENGKVYQNIAQNLTNAANVIGKANKEF